MINCPDCAAPMEAGYLSSRSPVFWSAEVSGLSFPSRSGDVPLGKMFGLLRPRAYLCRNCRKVIISY